MLEAGVLSPARTHCTVAHKTGLRTTPEAQPSAAPTTTPQPPTHCTRRCQTSSHPLSSMRQACWLYTLQSKAPGSSRSQSPSSCRLTSKKSVMVMSSKWAQALSSWYMVGPEPISMRTRPDTSPDGAEVGDNGWLLPQLPLPLVLSPALLQGSIWSKCCADRTPLTRVPPLRN